MRKGNALPFLLGIIAVSRDCFPIELFEKRRRAIVEAYGDGLYECPITVENEIDAGKAIDDVKGVGKDVSNAFYSTKQTISPNKGLVDYYNTKYQKYLKLYPMAKELS